MESYWVLDWNRGGSFIKSDLALLKCFPTKKRKKEITEKKGELVKIEH